MTKYPLYDKAKILVRKEYEDAFEIVKESFYHRSFANWKIKHTFQVSGAGNGILAHEPYFQNRSDEFIDICRTAILLHDVYRFREVTGWFQDDTKIDHSLMGAKLLSQTKDFNDILITLPIKHHGHMIEKLYEDEAYQTLNDDLKDKAKHISFAVRDADKIANWYSVNNEWEKAKEVWFQFPSDFSLAQAEINDELWSYFLRKQISPNYLCKTNADAAISTICWLFDMNYRYSLLYCKKFDLFERFCTVLKKLRVDETKIETVRKTMKNYVSEKFQIEI